MRIFITGSKGQLGSELRSLSADYADYTFEFTDSQECDITDAGKTKVVLAAFRPDVVINCAAYTAVDKAESGPELADAINHLAVKNLAVAAAELGFKLIHISTDFIFDGTAHAPITEAQQPNPLSVYGKTKLAGEKAIEEFCPSAVIIRTSWVYSTFGNNFVKTILRLCKEKRQLNIIFDQIGSPTYANDLAAFILAALPQIIAENISGVFHFSNEGVASWYDFAIAIRDLDGLTTPIFPIATSQYPTPAQRPHYSLLNKQKIKDTFQIRIPYWRDSLAVCIAKMK